MKIKNISQKNLERAFRFANSKFDRNLSLEGNWEKNCWKARLTVTDSEGLGAKKVNGRKTHFACWHAHGVFFDWVLKLSKNAIIYARNKKITREGGNWEDWDRGNGVMESECCRCDQIIYPVQGRTHAEQCTGGFFS